MNFISKDLYLKNLILFLFYRLPIPIEFKDLKF